MRKPFILAYILVLLISSCKNEQTVQQEPESKYIEITKEQFISEKMMIGSPEKMAIDERIHFSGKIIPMLNGIAKINAPVEGIVREVHVYNAQTVFANSPVLKIGGNALIELQQGFAMSSAKIKQLEANYKRTKALYNENIKTENEYMLAESEYQSELANYTALKLKLSQIGLDISTIEQGNYASTYSIKSPIDGQINKLNISPGQYINRENEIAEIVNKNKVELQLSFFENDYPKISKGQQIVFCGLNTIGCNAKAIITRVGTIIGANSKSLECYASINKEYVGSFAINQMVDGEVVVASDSVFAVPHQAIVSEGKNKYVIVLEEENENAYLVESVKVKIGKSDKHNVELLDFDKNKMLLLSGIQNIGIE